ncbi:hypothetical protein KY290_014829 [Solanum tuberosum]|uniref:ATP-dependent DNA helicase n=1 Tax=Solanum tuberosum TaxID=4113 RepID=A0ABQ7VSG8_SOLTU|nr:hypothetical protein KY290_014829 [Solanum tuberosum]
MGHDINEYNLVLENIRPSETTKDTKDIHFERNIIVSEEDLLLPKNLNAEQLISYNTIIDRISSKKAGAFFVDGPGGTGKTYLYRALLATVRSQGFIALATATSGVAASVLPGGRTAHSRFKMPIDIDDNFCCNVKFNMFWSKPHSLAPPPDSLSRIEELSKGILFVIALYFWFNTKRNSQSFLQCGGRWFKKLRSSTDLPISWFTRKTLLQLKQLKLRRRQARGTFVLSTLQSYCTAKAIEERGYIFHLRNLTTSPHIDSDIADCLNLSIDNAYLVENPGALDNAKLLAIYTADNFSSPEHHCQPSSAPHLIQLSYIFAPQMLVLGPGNARPAFTMDGQWRILETKVSNMDAKDTLQ